jgi:hypothetical protein
MEDVSVGKAAIRANESRLFLFAAWACKRPAVGAVRRDECLPAPLDRAIP